MDKEQIIEDVRKHIHEIRKDSPTLEDRDFRIALGKVLVEIKDAKKNGSKDVLKTIFSL